MKREWVAAERVEEVRAAARGWKRAGGIGEGAFEEISRRYPEPRTLPAPLWRILTFVFGSFILLAFAAFFALTVRPSGSSAWVLCAVLGVGFVIAADLQARSPAMALRGGVEAASFWGIVLLIGALFLLFEENLHLSEPDGPNLVLLGAVLLLAVGAFRWGNAVYAGFAAGALFVLLARAPHGRLLWIAGGVALSAVAGRFTDQPSWAPSHRACAWGLVVCGIAAVYAAVNFWSLDHRTIEQLGRHARSLPESWPGDGARAAAILATALVPLAVLLRGVVRRRKILLDTGLVLLALSLVTLRAYVHALDVRVVLAGAGALLIGGALALNRWLSRGSGGERRGFTADPLFGDETAFRAVELAPVLAAHAPAAKPADEPGFSGGGGGFGGGGAGTSY
ncbi:MAG TPA: hypothetical protein PLB01_00430 [Thermoanaerobaculia bacterium]|nr:hypothetical protein [Thermoanaerobaculia bacterium]